MSLKKATFFCLTFLVCTFVHSFAFAQESKVDSLLRILATAPKDTVRVNIYNQLFLEYEFVDDQKAGNYLNKALDLATTIHYKKGIADSYMRLGYFAEDKGDYLEALKNYSAVLEVAKDVGDDRIMADALKNIGIVYNYQGNYSEALSNCLKALRVMEAIGNKKGIADCYQSTGNIYSNQGNLDEALKEYLLALDVYKKIDYKSGIAYCYNNIGIVYHNLGKYADAFDNYEASLKMHLELDNKPGVALAYQNIGYNYTTQGNYKASLNFLLKSLEIREILGNKSGIAEAYFNIAANMVKQQRYHEAQQYLFKIEKLANEMENKKLLFETYKLLAFTESSVRDFKSAYFHAASVIIYFDTIYGEETQKKIVEAKMTYDFEKRELQAKAEQDKKDIVAKEELKQKEQQRNYFIAGFALVGLLALFILRSYKQKQKANLIITEQKNEVEKAKQIIEEKNKDITDSINYAKRIQRAMLPNLEDISTVFLDNFVLFKPKDIVSGDFYFFHTDNRTSYIAVADCTGHGVPGAFMSLIGTDKLQDAVLKSSDASEVLMELNKGIKRALKQTDSNDSTRDGMDIALCIINKENNTLSYAGANRPLWLIRNGHTEIEEVKATKCAIGGLTEDDQQFEVNELKLEPGDTYYITTDGYADQFSGKTEKKLMSKRLKEILVDIQSLPMNEQKKYLDNFIEDWKAGAEQVDDILVIGVRI